MKVFCWQHYFLLLRSAPARQAGYAEALGFASLPLRMQ
jgi:hypothetical protein